MKRIISLLIFIATFNCYAQNVDSTFTVTFVESARANMPTALNPNAQSTGTPVDSLKSRQGKFIALIYDDYYLTEGIIRCVYEAMCLWEEYISITNPIVFDLLFDDDMDDQGRPVQKYLIADEDREKYIERSVLVNMTLLRKTASEKAQTGAILRVIRGLLGIKGTYTLEELKKPFAVASVTFSPDYTDPQVRSAMLQQGMNSMSNMFGMTSPAPAIAENSHSDDFNPEEYADNPAFASDSVPMADDLAQEIPSEPEYEAPEPPQENYIPQEENQDELICSECGTAISQKVFDYSVKKFGRPLCYEHQKGAV